VITVDVAKAYIDGALGLADISVEIANAPKAWWGTSGLVVWSRSYEKRGYFAAWERPGEIVEGMGEMSGKCGGAYGVVGSSEDD
jgi:hypothetical protein